MQGRLLRNSHSLFLNSDMQAPGSPFQLPMQMRHGSWNLLGKVLVIKVPYGLHAGYLMAIYRVMPITPGSQLSPLPTGKNRSLPNNLTGSIIRKLKLYMHTMPLKWQENPEGAKGGINISAS